MLNIVELSLEYNYLPELSVLCVSTIVFSKQLGITECIINSSTRGITCGLLEDFISYVQLDTYTDGLINNWITSVTIIVRATNDESNQEKKACHDDEKKQDEIKSQALILSLGQAQTVLNQLNVFNSTQ